MEKDDAAREIIELLVAQVDAGIAELLQEIELAEGTLRYGTDV